eukprot:CAMPEP_0176424198 /NCGR_PEP_ID=MMETSP0127-20121128/10707_1 /TAXON_ID=938130 /ORGANISM="Platyophrya macrostoma, Strain WH" /LENGTH=358 /DNA_ID=CAMNT_0017805235 /DNA_START=186 /DNA_END=1262 /DNA_ORIENTATION=+
MFLPKKVDGFDNNVKKVAAGPNHTAVITTDGDLYTFGAGRALGHGDGYHVTYLPKRVDYFKNSSLKVKDVAVGANHTIAVTENDEVWAWGAGAGDSNIFYKIFLGSVGALGQSNNSNRGVPTLIPTLKGKGPFKQVSAGYQSSFALTEKGDLYHWGKSKYGALGDGNFEDVTTPVLNSHFAELKSHEHVHIVKLRSCAYYNVAQLSNGKLISWGADYYGQTGLGRDINTEFVEEAAVPNEIVDTEYHGKKVVDFQLSEDCLMILTEDNQIYYCGMRKYGTPHRFETDNKLKVKKIAAGMNSFAILTDKNEILSQFGFAPSSRFDKERKLEVGDTHTFGNGEIVDFGGSYKTRYAIVRN